MSCTRPIHSRPFDHEAAKAGAPVALECGWPLTIHKWNCNNQDRPIVGIYGTDDRLGAWHADGSFAMSDHSRLALVMTPLGHLDDKPVFVGDTIIDEEGEEHKAWATCKFPGKWRWPAPPKVYPVTGMTNKELLLVNSSGPGPSTIDDLRYNAKIAIRHYIDNLGVMPDDCALRAKLVELGWTAP